jgi:hypothetical protein
LQLELLLEAFAEALRAGGGLSGARRGLGGSEDMLRVVPPEEVQEGIGTRHGSLSCYRPGRDVNCGVESRS